MSMSGVPYSPIVPSLTRWVSGRAVADREQDVEVADDVVRLRVRRMADVDHRVGRRRLLAVVDDRVRAEAVDHALDEGVVDEVADVQLDLVLGDLAPGADPLVKGRGREQRADAQLELPLALGEVVDDGDAVARARERHRGRPSEIAVATEHQDPLGHVHTPSTDCVRAPRPGRGVGGSLPSGDRCSRVRSESRGPVVPSPGMLIRQFVHRRPRPPLDAHRRRIGRPRRGRRPAPRRRRLPRGGAASSTSGSATSSRPTSTTTTSPAVASSRC